MNQEKIRYLVQKSSTNRIKYLKFVLKGRHLSREWGLLHGESSSNSYTYDTINEGKANELTPEQAAEADFNRIIAKKMKEGYVHTVSLENLPELPNYSDQLNFDEIPTSMCCSKPIVKISMKAIDELIAKEHAKFFIKYNGACHYIVITEFHEVKIFTRRWEDHTSKYPSIVEAVEGKVFDPSTIIICEFCIDPLLKLDHMKAQQYMSEIMKANTVKGKCKKDQSKALERQEVYPVKAAIFGYLYHNNVPVWKLPYSELLDTIKQTIAPLSKGELLFQPQEANIKSGKEAFTLAKQFKKKIEGFVLWDTSASMAVTWNGKPLRRAAYKIKAKGEMDVIAYEGLFGKVAGEYGSLKIGKYDPKGKLIPLGSVSGLKPKKGETKPSYWKFPCVIEVTYDNIFPDTGFLQFGNFSKIHEDKTIDEVETFSLASGEK